MPLQSLDVTTGRRPPSRRPQAPQHAGGGQAHRRLALHRLQGLPGRLHGVERPPRPRWASNVEGCYTNPPDLSDQSWCLMRFNEEEIDGNLQWLILKDGCLHCSDPGCLKACPAPGAIVAVLQRHRRLPAGALHRLRLLHQPAARSTSRGSGERTPRSTSARSAPTGSRWGSSRPASRPARPRRSPSAPRRTCSTWPTTGSRT